MELKVATDIIYEGLINIVGKPPSLVVSWYNMIILLGISYEIGTNVLDF
jgi:hypothetical protein